MYQINTILYQQLIVKQEGSKATKKGQLLLGKRGEESE